MRVLILALLVVAVAACSNSATGGELTPASPDTACAVDTDCELVSSKCCECPSFAVHKLDPLTKACGSVECESKQACSEAVAATCNRDTKSCELTCKPLACAAQPNCEQGFLLDDNGCLTCECVGITFEARCFTDDQCVRTPADCCGCSRGGSDTAVFIDDLDAFEKRLDCRQDEVCPELDTCTDDEPICVQGSCMLGKRDLPPGACGGRPELATCPEDQACVVNADAPLAPQATQHRVGLCGPPPS